MSYEDDREPEVVEAMEGLRRRASKKSAAPKVTPQPSPFDSMTPQQRIEASRDGGLKTQRNRHAFGAASWEKAKELAALGRQWKQQWLMGADTTATIQGIREIILPCFRKDGRLNAVTLGMLDKYASSDVSLEQDGESVRVTLPGVSAPGFVVTYQG